MNTLRNSTAARLPFGDYASCYDLLYRDKDYAGEADYIARTLRSAMPDARKVLELGSGTGRHGRSLAGKGFSVHGIERSPDMVAVARSVPVVAAAGRFDCEVGDLRVLRLDRRFDAVISLFHVVSYQTTDNDLAAAFATAARHLAPGGLFLFDVWHGPAVEAQRPEPRIKKVADDALDVVRKAQPTLDAATHTVRVSYDIECRERHSGAVTHFSEDHLLRYLFPAEIAALAAASGMRVTASEEFMTGTPPSAATWSVAYLLRK